MLFKVDTQITGKKRNTQNETTGVKYPPKWWSTRKLYWFAVKCGIYTKPSIYAMVLFRTILTYLKLA